jgi:cytochrome c oxidase subunit III
LADVTAHHGPVHLAHQFDSLEQQREASNLAMWVFLITEIMFFGGLFCIYLIYRQHSPAGFAAASHELDWKLGTTNTAVLIASSLTMALAVWSAQAGRRKALVGFLIVTMLLGSVFLGLKSYEYAHKFHEHHVPGPNFVWDGEHAADAQMFYVLYFAMTGLHAVHMIAGIAVMLVITFFAWRGKFGPDYYNPVECAGLYWHFVDIIWIFLFPLLYLIGRHAHGGG